MSLPTINQRYGTGWFGGGAKPIVPRKPPAQVPGFNPLPQQTAAAAQTGMTPAQMLAKAQDLANIQQTPDIASIKDQQAYAQAVYDAQVQKIQAIGAALQGFLGPIGGQVNDVYKGAASGQEAFGKGYSDAMQQLTQGSANDVNSTLAHIGAPQGQNVPGSQSSDAAAVLNAVGGAIPAEQFRTQGTAYQGAAASFPATAAAQGNIQSLQAKYTYQQQAMEFQKQLEALARQNPLVVAQFLDELYTFQQNAQQNSQSQAMTLYNAGMITQRDLANQLGLPNPARYPNKTIAELTPSTPKIMSTKDGNIISIDPKTGKTSLIYQGSQGPANVKGSLSTGLWRQNPDGTVTVISQPRSPNLAFKNINGHLWSVDPTTGKKIEDLGVAGNPAKPTQPAHGQLTTIGDKPVIFHPDTNTITDLQGNPVDPSTLSTKTTKPKYTPHQLQQFKATAADTAHDAWFGVSRAPTAAELKADPKLKKVWEVRPMTYQQVAVDMLSHGIPLNIVQAALNRYWKRPGYDANVDGRMSGNTVWEKSPVGRPTVPYQQRHPPKGDAAATGGDQASFKNGYPTMHQTSGVVPQYKGITASNADIYHVDTRLLTAISQFAAFIGKTVTINSGYRDPAYSAKVGGYSRDPHTRGVAVDAYIDGVPIGNVPGAVAWFKAHGIESGAQPGFYHGKADPMHLQIPGSGVNKSVYAGTTLGDDTQNVSSGSTVKTAAGAQAAGMQMAAKYGWQGSEWQALNKLWTKESGWDYTISGGSGDSMIGIPQANPSLHNLPADFATNPLTQIKWGLSYIKKVYRSPSRAWAFWNATVSRNANLAPPDLRGKARTWIAKGYTGY